MSQATPSTPFMLSLAQAAHVHDATVLTSFPGFLTCIHVLSVEVCLIAIIK